MPRGVCVYVCLFQARVISLSQGTCDNQEVTLRYKFTFFVFPTHTHTNLGTDLVKHDSFMQNGLKGETYLMIVSRSCSVTFSTCRRAWALVSVPMAESWPGEHRGTPFS